MSSTWKISPIHYSHKSSTTTASNDENDHNVKNVIEENASLRASARYGNFVGVAKGNVLTVLDGYGDEKKSASITFQNTIDVVSMSENVVIVGDSSMVLHFSTYLGKKLHSQPLPRSQGPFVDIHINEDCMYVLTASGKCYVFSNLDLEPLIENLTNDAIKTLKSKMRTRVLDVGVDCRLIANEREVGILSRSSFKVWNQDTNSFVLTGTFLEDDKVDTAMWCPSSQDVLALRDARTSKSSLFLVSSSSREEWILPYLHQFSVLCHDNESIRVVTIRCMPDGTIAEIRDLSRKHDGDSKVVFKLQTKPRHDCILLASSNQTFFVIPTTATTTAAKSTTKSLLFRCDPKTTTTTTTTTSQILSNEIISQALETLELMPFNASCSSQGIQTELKSVDSVELVVACCLEAKLKDHISTSQVLQYALSRCKKESKELSNLVSKTIERLVTFVRMSASLTHLRFREWNSSRWHVFRKTEMWNAAALLLKQCQFASVSVLSRRHQNEVLRGDRLVKLLENVPDTPSDWINSSKGDWNRFLMWIKLEVSSAVSQDTNALESLASWLVRRIERSALQHSTPEFPIRLASTFLTKNHDISVLSSTITLVHHASLEAIDHAEISDTSMCSLRSSLIEMRCLKESHGVSVTFDEIRTMSREHIAKLVLDHDDDDDVLKHLAPYCKRNNLDTNEMLYMYVKDKCKASSSSQNHDGPLDVNTERKLIACIYLTTRKVDSALLLFQRSRPPYSKAVRNLMDDAIKWAKQGANETLIEELNEQKRLMRIDTVLVKYCTSLAAASFNFVDVAQARELLHHILAQVPSLNRDVVSQDHLQPLKDALVIVGGYSALNECDIYTQFLQNLILPHMDDPISCDKMEMLILSVLDRSEVMQGLRVAKRVVYFCVDVANELNDDDEDDEYNHDDFFADLESASKVQVASATHAATVLLRWMKSTIANLNTTRQETKMKCKRDIEDDVILAKWLSWSVDRLPKFLCTMLKIRRMQLEFDTYVTPKQISCSEYATRLLLKKLNNRIVEGVDEKSRRAELFRFAHLLFEGDSNQSATRLRGTFARVRAKTGNYLDAMTWSRDMWNHLHISAESIASRVLVDVSMSLLRHNLSSLEDEDETEEDVTEENSIRNEKVTEGCTELLCKAVATCDLNHLDSTLSFWQRTDLAHATFLHSERGDFGKLLNRRGSHTLVSSSLHKMWQRDDNIVLPETPSMLRALKFALHDEVDPTTLSSWLCEQSAELLATRTNLLSLQEPAVAVSAMLQKSTRSARVDAHLCFSFMLLLMSDDKGSSIYRQAVRFQIRDIYELVARGGRFGGSNRRKKGQISTSLIARIAPESQPQLFRRLLRLGRTGMEAAHACGDFDLLREAAAVEANAHWWSRLCDLSITFDICQFPDPLFGVQSNPPVSPSVSQSPAQSRAYLETIVPLMLQKTNLELEETLMFGRQYGLEDAFTAMTYLKMLLLVTENDDSNLSEDEIRDHAKKASESISRESLIQLLSDILNRLDGKMHARLQLVTYMLLKHIKEEAREEKKKKKKSRRATNSKSTEELLQRHNSMKMYQRLYKILDVLLTFSVPLDAKAVLEENPWNAIDPILSVSTLRYLIALASPLRLKADDFVVRLLEKSYKHERYSSPDDDDHDDDNNDEIKKDNSLPPVNFLKEQLSRIEDFCVATSIAEWVANQYPFTWSFGVGENEGSSRRLEALSVACEMAARWKQSPSDDIEREEASTIKNRLDTSRRDLAVQIALAKLRPGAVPHVMELKSLWNEPEKLLCRLYHSMAHIAETCGDLHSVVDEIANLYDRRVVDASKIRKFVVRHWLQRGGVVPLLRSKERDDENQEEEQEELNEEEIGSNDDRRCDLSNSVFTRTVQEIELEEERRVVDRICYVLRLGGDDALRKRCTLLIEYATGSKSASSSTLAQAGSFRSKCRALHAVFLSLSPCDLVSTLNKTSWTVPSLMEFWKCCEHMSSFETLRLPLSMSQFQSCDKLGLVRGLWRKLADLAQMTSDTNSRRRAVRLSRLFVQLMVDFHIEDLQLWVALLSMLQKLEMHRDLFALLDVMPSFRCLTEKLSSLVASSDSLIDELKHLWDDILLQPVRELSSGCNVDDSDTISTVLAVLPVRIEACPHFHQQGFDLKLYRDELEELSKKVSDDKNDAAGFEHLTRVFLKRCGNVFSVMS